MTINPYLNFYNNSPEQQLISKLNVESIQQTGFEMKYLPRRKGDYNDIMNEDAMSFFDTAYDIEMYIKSVDGFEGEGSFLSKFGLEVRDRVTLSVARQRFSDEIGIVENTTRPKEGDLIYFSMTKKIFEIIYVDNRAIFYPLGSLPLFDIQCEVFEYSMEDFKTGIDDIDQIQTNYSLDQVPHRLYDANNEPIFNEDGTNALDDLFNMEEIDPGFDNDIILDGAKDDVNVNIKDPFRRR